MNYRLVVASSVALVIAGVIAGGVVFAAGDRNKSGSGISAIPGGESPDERQQRLVAKLADVLGLDQQQVSDAYEAALADVRTARLDSAIDSKIAQMLAAGRITQDQADTLKAWLSSRPAALNKLPRIPGLEFGAPLLGRERPALWQPGEQMEPVYEAMSSALGKEAIVIAEAFATARRELAREDRLAAVNDFLDEMVADGRLTQVEADELSTWLDGAPAFLGDMPWDSANVVPFGAGSLFGGVPTQKFPFGIGPESEMALPNGGKFEFHFGGPGEGSPRFEFRSFALPEGLGLTCEVLEPDALQELMPRFFRDGQFGHGLLERVAPGHPGQEFRLEMHGCAQDGIPQPGADDEDASPDDATSTPAQAA